MPRTVVVGGGYYGRSYYSYRPYYSFVPRISLGLGLWAGYPISWSASWGYNPYYYDGYYPSYPYYSYPNAYSAYPSYPPPPPDDSAYGSGSTYPQQPYPQQQYPQQPVQPQQPQNGSMNVQPGAPQNATGGVSFDVTPGTASVFVDGTYMGTGADFGPSAQPLGLTPGRHHVEIRAEGYQTMSFDADVTAGQVTPYRATLQRR
ncbi:MAG: PEGA domain-containing protein [Vicinamibacterales bacterium]